MIVFNYKILKKFFDNNFFYVSVFKKLFSKYDKKIYLLNLNIVKIYL